MKLCVNCGKEILDTAKFCIYCTARQPDPEPGETAEKMRAPQAAGPEENDLIENEPAEWESEENAPAAEEPAVRRRAAEKPAPERPAGSRPPAKKTAGKNAAGKKPAKKKKKKSNFLADHRNLLLVAAAVVIIVAVIVGISSTRKAVIDLSAYTDVTFSGYNGDGTAQVVVDENRLLCDVAKAMAGRNGIKKSFVKDMTPDNVRDVLNSDMEAGAKIALAADGFEYTLDKSQGLSEGDVVTVSYRYNNSETETYGFRFKGEDKAVTVSGLAEMERFDAFAGLEVSITGPDGYGQAEITQTLEDDLINQLEYTVDQDENLHNGDSIHVTVTERNGGTDFTDMGRIYGKIPAETTKTYEVTGLTEYPTFDAFAGLSVEMEGVEPFGYIYITNTDETSDIWYEADKYDYLSNGDVITVRANSGYTGAFNADYAEIFGQVPEKVEKTIEIEGLPTYLSSLADIPTDSMTEMKAYAADRLNAYTEEEWVAGSDRLNSGTYMGAYLLTAKDPGVMWNRNQLYLIYEVNATASNTESSRVITFYFYVRFQDILKMSDGTCYVDYEEAQIPDVSFDTGFDGHYYRGFEELDYLIASMIDSQASMYDIDTDMTVTTSMPDTSEEDTGTDTSEEDTGTDTSSEDAAMDTSAEDTGTEVSADGNEQGTAAEEG